MFDFVFPCAGFPILCVLCDCLFDSLCLWIAVLLDLLFSWFWFILELWVFWILFAVCFRFGLALLCVLHV